MILYSSPLAENHQLQLGSFFHNIMESEKNSISKEQSISWWKNCGNLLRNDNKSNFHTHLSDFHFVKAVVQSKLAITTIDVQPKLILMLEDKNDKPFCLWVGVSV